MASIVKTTRRRKATIRRHHKQRRRRCRQVKAQVRRRRHARPASLPQRIIRVIGGLLQLFAAAFTRPTAQRFTILLLAAIVTTGSRTVLNMLRTVGSLAPGAASSYHRVFAKRRWSLWHLGRVLAGYLLSRWVPAGPVQAGAGLVPVRWVYVHDRSGTHRDEYFFSRDVDMTAKEIVEAYTRRWNVETTFQEMRCYLKLAKTRGWTEQTVLRTAPCLFGLYAVIAVFYAELPRSWQWQRAVTSPGKEVVTFSDAITAVRRWLWAEWILATPDHQQAFAKIPRRLRATLLYGLAPAA